jgi:hypothetical protein
LGCNQAGRDWSPNTPRRSCNRDELAIIIRPTLSGEDLSVKTGSSSINAPFHTMSGSCGIRPPLQGSDVFAWQNLGRCPGLRWIVPLGLQAPEQQNREPRTENRERGTKNEEPPSLHPSDLCFCHAAARFVRLLRLRLLLRLSAVHWTERSLARVATMTFAKK